MKSTNQSIISVKEIWLIFDKFYNFCSCERIQPSRHSLSYFRLSWRSVGDVKTARITLAWTVHPVNCYPCWEKQRRGDPLAQRDQVGALSSFNNVVSSTVPKWTFDPITIIPNDILHCSFGETIQWEYHVLQSIRLFASIFEYFRVHISSVLHKL